MKDKLFQPLITSLALHTVFVIMLCTSILSFKFPQNNEMEIELASIGELDKDIGGTGKGDIDTPQPMESIKEVIKESEITPEDKPEVEEDRQVKDETVTPPPVAPAEPTPPAVDNSPNTPGEDIPVVKPKKQLQVEPIKKTDKVDRPPKRKKNAIIDLLLQKAKNDSDFDKMMNNFGNEDKLNLSKYKHSASSKVKGEGGGGGGTALSSGNYDLVKKQVMPHWIVTDDKYIVRLKITVQENGVIKLSDIKVEDMVKYNTDHQYRVAVDSARRALIASSPLKLPKDVINKLKGFTVVFDPRNAL